MQLVWVTSGGFRIYVTEMVVVSSILYISEATYYCPIWWTGRISQLNAVFYKLIFVSVSAVFLIPYLFFLVLCGMPLFFLEVSYGQFASLSPITAWRLSPLFKGIDLLFIPE